MDLESKRSDWTNADITEGEDKFNFALSFLLFYLLTADYK